MSQQKRSQLKWVVLIVMIIAVLAVSARAWSYPQVPVSNLQPPVIPTVTVVPCIPEYDDCPSKTTPSPTSIPTVTPAAIAPRGGSGSNSGPRYMMRGSCFYSASLGIAELGNDEQSTGQYFVTSFADYMKLCLEYQKAVRSNRLTEAIPDYVISSRVPNGMRI